MAFSSRGRCTHTISHSQSASEAARHELPTARAHVVLMMCHSKHGMGLHLHSLCFICSILVLLFDWHVLLINLIKAKFRAREPCAWATGEDVISGWARTFFWLALFHAFGLRPNAEIHLSIVIIDVSPWFALRNPPDEGGIVNKQSVTDRKLPKWNKNPIDSAK